MNNDIELENMMMAWNRNDSKWQRPGGSPGQFDVCKHPDNGQLAHLMYWTAPFQDFVPERAPTKKEAKEIFLKLKMMIEAWHIVYRDGVPIENVHKALMRVPEYRAMLSGDFETGRAKE